MEGDEETRKAANYIAGMKEYAGAIRSVVTLSTTMLVLPITVLKAVKGDHFVLSNCWLLLGWALLGISIVSGILYQGIAARKIFWKLGHSEIPEWANWPNLTYWVSFLALLGGLFFLVIGLLTV